MKRAFILGLLAFATTAATAFGTGTIILDNYNSSGPYITYGQAGIPLNGQSGAAGALGQKVVGNPNGASPWTVGVYWALGNVKGSVSSDPTGTADPTALGGGLVLGTGNGSTAGLNDDFAPGLPGTFFINRTFNVPGTADFGGNTVTLIVVAFSGTTYDDSLFRGHSAAFTLVTTAGTSPTPSRVGDSMSAFSVFIVPEPSMLALFGIGGAVLVLFRRRRSLVLASLKNPR